MREPCRGVIILLGVAGLSHFSWAATINVPAGGDFQAALDSALPGDLIVLQAGASYPTGAGFTLRNKGSSTQFITIQTSALSSLPAAGYRVHPADAPTMAKLVATRSAIPVLHMAAGAHHYRLIGIEFAMAAGQWAYTMVELGVGTETVLSDVPHDVEIDRCYIHGDPTAQPGTKRGVQFNGMHQTLKNSYVSEIHALGQDSQAVGGWTGTGPFSIVNNYLEASTENILFGGANAPITGTIPSDIEVRYNYLYKPRSWHTTDPSYGGIHWSIKNSFELKNARRVTVDGNIFENCWSDAQVGFAIVLTPRGNNNPLSTVEDVTFTHNIVRHTASGVNMLSEDNPNVSDSLKRVTVRDNLIEDVNPAAFGGAGRIFQFAASAAGPAQQITVDHNTALHAASGGQDFASVGDCCTFSDGFNFTNNLVTHGTYGFFGSGSSEGTASLTLYFRNWIMTKNAIMNGGKASIYPTGNFFPANPAAVQFVNFVGGDYRLAATSPYYHAGTDGKDLGADMPAILSATCGAVSGVPQASCASGILPPPPPTSACDINQDGVTTVADVQLMANQALGVAPCSVDLNRDGRCSVVDVQKVVNGVLGKGCIVP